MPRARHWWAGGAGHDRRDGRLGSVLFVIVDRAIYRDGKRTAEPQDLSEMSAACQRDGGIDWVGLYRPTEQEFAVLLGLLGDRVRGRDLSRRRPGGPRMS